VAEEERDVVEELEMLPVLVALFREL